MIFSREVVRFIFVGITTNVFNFLLFLLFRALDVSVFSSSLCAYMIAIIYSFMLSNFFVFDQNSNNIHPTKVASYSAVIAASALIQASTTAGLYALSDMQNISWAVGAVVAAIINYVSLKRFVFAQ